MGVRQRFGAVGVPTATLKRNQGAFPLAPLLIIVIAVVGMVFGQQAAQGEIVVQLRGISWIYANRHGPRVLMEKSVRALA